jgi:hypothetical protein
MANRLIFIGSGTFEALNKAKDWCSENGYSYGSLQADAPIGFLKGDFQIAKWRNLSKKERDGLDGIMDAPGRTYRTGPVTITLSNERESL